MFVTESFYIDLKNISDSPFFNLKHSFGSPFWSKKKYPIPAKFQEPPSK